VTERDDIDGYRKDDAHSNRGRGGKRGRKVHRTNNPREAEGVSFHSEGATRGEAGAQGRLASHGLQAKRGLWGER